MPAPRLTLRSLATHLLLAAPLTATPILAQSTATQPLAPTPTNAQPTFAVATIKPHDPASPRQGFDINGDRITIRNESVAKLLQMAYAIHPRQIINAPDWLFHDTYDIEGKIDSHGESTVIAMHDLIPQLLAERFAFKFHREQRIFPVYAIEIAKGGPHLPPPADPTAETDQDASTHGTETTVTVTSASMADFILCMQFFFDRPLVDQTHLTARYDFKLNYTFDETHATDPDAAPGDPNAPPGLFTAIQQQLGLKLQPTKAPVNIFVIDRIAPPSPN
jgi:uncharacterized protein (TIGR03435 family)